MIYTVFPKEEGEMPQDFPTYSDAQEPEHRRGATWSYGTGSTGCGNRGYESCSRECRVRSICLGQAERYVCSDRQASTSKAVVFETIPGESKKRRDTELDRSGEVQDFGENGRRDCKRLEGGKG